MHLCLHRNCLPNTIKLQEKVVCTSVNIQSALSLTICQFLPGIESQKFSDTVVAVNCCARLFSATANPPKGLGGGGHQIRCDMSDRRGGRVAPNGKRGEGQKQAMSLGFSCSESFQLTGSIQSQTQPPQPPPFTGPEKILRLPPRAPAK